MQFKPLTAEEAVNTYDVLPEGDYPFVVIKSEEKTSKKGSPMIEIEIEINDGGFPVTIKDWLLAEPKLSAVKFRHFCDSTGMLALYEQGTLSPRACFNKEGVVSIVIKQDKKEDGTLYPPKNAVKDYVLRDTQPIAHDDGLPF